MKLNYPYGKAQRCTRLALTNCESLMKSRLWFSLLRLKAQCSRVNLYPLVQGVSDCVIKFCIPPLSGTLIELPPCGASSCSFWSQRAAVVNWSVMDSTAGKVRQSALLMHSPCQNLYTTHLETLLRLSGVIPVWGCGEVFHVSQSFYFLSAEVRGNSRVVLPFC